MTDFAPLPGFTSTETAEEGAVLHLLRDDGSEAFAADGTAMTLTLLGSDSEIYRKHFNDFQTKALERLARKRGKAPSQEEMQERAILSMAAVTTGWTGFTDAAGQAVPFSRKAAEALYRAYPSIREQAEGFVGDRANFMTKSAPSSAPSPSTSSNSTSSEKTDPPAGSTS